MPGLGGEEIIGFLKKFFEAFGHFFKGFLIGKPGIANMLRKEFEIFGLGGFQPKSKKSLYRLVVLPGDRTSQL